MKKLFLIAAVTMLALAFSGCNVLETDTEALMKPPVFTEEQEKLNAALTEVIGESYVLKYPETGEINSAFIFKDLDGDGTEEAMAFYSLLDESTRINILKNKDEKWVSVYEAAGFYGNIKSVNFAKIEEEGFAIVINWDQEVGIYRYKKEKLEKVHGDSCEGTEIADINGDGLSEIIIISKNPMGQSTLEIVYNSGSEILVTDDISMHAGYGNIFAKGSAKFSEEKTMYFIDSEIYEGVYLTEMFALENGQAKRYFIADFVEYEEEEEERENEGVVVVVGGSYGKRGIFLRNTKVSCLDTNSDGIIEMPVEFREDYAQDASEEFFFLQYMQYDGEKSKAVWNGFANTEGGYLFEVPEKWNEKITVKIGSSPDEFVFSESKNGNVVYEIFAISKNDYQDKYEDCVLAAEDKTKNYYIKSFVDEKSEFYIAPEKYSESFIFI
ncbi:MAG: hypothetical protein J6A12_03120 [Oscillospiraceae bacterium]|nr:hypothetical protein [Oscillospiraceae bacterium]